MTAKRKQLGEGAQRLCHLTLTAPRKQYVAFPKKKKKKQLMFDVTVLQKEVVLFF